VGGCAQWSAGLAKHGLDGVGHDLSGAKRPALCNSDAVMIGVVGVLNRP
jgi:hypothetical protein